MNNAKLNEEFMTSSPGGVIEALGNLKELAENQAVGDHLREMYMAWLGSESSNNVDPSSRPNYYESYESLSLLLKALQAVPR